MENDRRRRRDVPHDLVLGRFVRMFVLHRVRPADHHQRRRRARFEKGHRVQPVPQHAGWYGHHHHGPVLVHHHRYAHANRGGRVDHPGGDVPPYPRREHRHHAHRNHGRHRRVVQPGRSHASRPVPLVLQPVWDSAVVPRAGHEERPTQRVPLPGTNDRAPQVRPGVPPCVHRDCVPDHPGDLLRHRRGGDGVRMLRHVWGRIIFPET
mmetsp:Transcript_5147/g.17171  ORF Transcript_5147/g.17171 Transcript_5147/m.17171 type:complete len:208 (+) Transcript_5147:1481-2104(+)